MAVLQDPTTIILTPSPTPGVTRYVLTFTNTVGGQAPLPYDAGNPPTNADGLILIPMDQARQGDTSTGPFKLTAIAMAGELQSAASTPSDDFEFSPPPEPTPPSAPTQIALGGGYYK